MPTFFLGANIRTSHRSEVANGDKGLAREMGSLILTPTHQSSGNAHPCSIGGSVARATATPLLVASMRVSRDHARTRYMYDHARAMLLLFSRYGARLGNVKLL